MSWTPHDLPHLVEIFAAEADRESGLIDEVTAGFSESDRAQARPVLELGERQHLMAEMSRGAPLHWMDTDVCALVRHSALTVPSWSPSAAMPAPSGIVAFEDRVLTAPEDHDEDARQVNVDAIAWQVRGAQVFVTALSLRRGASRPRPGKIEAMIHRVFPGFPLPPAKTSPLAELFTLTIEFDSVQGSDLPPGVTEAADDEVARTVVRTYGSSAEELLCVLGSVWLLMGQPRVVEDAEPVTETVRTTGPVTAGGGQSRKVRRQVIVSVRRLTPEAASAHGRGHGPARSRWWVRGHWRQQPWGKKRSLRKPVYIAPHTAGARDAAEPEADDRPSVRVWRQ